MKNKLGDAPVRKSHCATCPWREGSPHAHLQDTLTLSALSEASRICHSTGTNAIGGRTGKAEVICRGARDVQLKFFCLIGVITDATDAAWNAQRVKSGMKAQRICA